MTTARPPDNIDDLLPDENDLIYEEELLRNPYSMKLWWRYIEARKEAHPKKRYLLYERAVKALPGSYKVSARNPEENSNRANIGLLCSFLSAF